MFNKIEIPIPINAEVVCLDGKSGISCHIIINPVTKNITHIVVKDSHFSDSNKRLVPIEKIINSTSDSIALGCSLEELSQMEPFTEIHYIKPDADTLSMMTSIEQYEEMLLYDPYVLPYGIPIIPIDSISVEEERIPPGELAVHRGAQVKATDGIVGKVDEFLVESQTGHITHLVIREGHFWNRKEVAIPLSAIQHISEEVVYLKLDKETVESLPEIDIKRPYIDPSILD